MTDLPKRVVTLLDAARVVARGGDIDSKLAELAGQARDASDADAVVVYMVDALAEQLIPSAMDTPSSVAAAIITLASAPERLRAAVVDRAVQSLSAAEVAQLRSSLPRESGAAVVPLVATDQAGDPELEGLLLVAHADPDAAGASESLLAVADLAAVAVRQARLENTLHEHVDWLDRVANTDALTGLANRPTFDRMLQLEIARAVRQGSPVGLAVFRVEGLDALAERDGAGAADDALRRVAATMADQLRIIDTVARIAPTMFAAICPGSVGSEAAERIREAVNNPSTAAATTDGISVTPAVRSYPESAQDPNALLESALNALQVAA